MLYICKPFNMYMSARNCVYVHIHRNDYKIHDTETVTKLINQIYGI